MGTRIVNAAGRLLVAAFVAVCVAVLAYGLLAAALTGAVHGGGCGRSSSFYRDRAYLPAARRAFRHHARRCPCVPSRWPRRLTVTAFVLALAAVAFAATVAGLSSLAVPAPATPTTITAPPAYVPIPAGPPATSRAGGGR